MGTGASPDTDGAATGRGPDRSRVTVQSWPDPGRRTGPGVRPRDTSPVIGTTITSSQSWVLAHASVGE
jgi:hypothetical protein